MRDEFINKGKLAVGEVETIHIGTHESGYGYRITRFDLWGGADVLGVSAASEYCGIITAESTAADSSAPDFNQEGQIAVAMWGVSHNLVTNVPAGTSCIDDLFVCTQDLLLEIKGTSSTECNYMIKFEKVKLSSSAQAVQNYKQYSIFDE
jgi:hypothetical protein